MTSDERRAIGMAVLAARDAGTNETDAAAAKAVELVAARGGTMTEDELSSDLLMITENWRTTGVALREHISAQGARIAAMEKLVSELKQERERQSAFAREEIDRRERAEVLAATLRASQSALQEHISDLEKSLENARKERSEAQNASERVCGALGDERVARKAAEQSLRIMQTACNDAARQRDAARQEVETLKADSLSRTMVIRDMIDEGWWEHTDDDCPEDDSCQCELLRRANDAASLEGHPGAALLEEHRKALVRAKNEGLEKAAKIAKDFMDASQEKADRDSESPNPDAANWAMGGRDVAKEILESIDAMREPAP